VQQLQQQGPAPAPVDQQGGWGAPPDVEYGGPGVGPTRGSDNSSSREQRSYAPY
jgi:hypothetical protein